MKLSPYLMFEGNCREAFTAYQAILGGRIEAMMDHRGTPAEAHVPPEWLDKILHACLVLDGQMLMASDAPPGRSDGRCAASRCRSTCRRWPRPSASSPRSEGATIQMPMEETFWSPRFGMLRDRFGTNWMIGADMPAEKNCGG